MIMMYGTLFMMAGAYTLSKNGHVRGDVLYGFFQPRTRPAGPDPVLPVLHARRVCAGLGRLELRQRILGHQRPFERHRRRPPVYPFKFIMPLAGAFLLLQGMVEIVRCVLCIRDGEWPSREHDVEEVDVEKLKEMVHVKDEDIAALDKFVVAQELEGLSTRRGGQMKIRKELWFGFSLMAVILLVTAIFMPWSNMQNGHLGLLMLSLVVVAIMLGFPTAFTLMGMGMIFAWLAYAAAIRRSPCARRWT
jgi:hypothetical protein